LTLTSAKINLRKNEYSAGILFVAVSRVCTLKDILFDPFLLQRLQKIKQSKRL
ncbi:3844_t:CDS:1, partial [Racocetra persica]